MADSTTTSSAKLTKKQKKAVAFRDRAQGKSKKSKNSSVPAEDGEEGNDVPVNEDQEMAELEVLEDKKDKEEIVARKKSKVSKKDTAITTKPRTDDGEGSRAEKKSTKRKREEAEGEANEGTSEPAVKKNKKEKKKAGADGQTQRFILFVGNLKYTTSLEAIQSHFAACDPPPTVRLLTPKATPNSSNSAATKFKSKGCAFLEFTHRNALQQALKLHQSELDGRRINVELTAGGGGKGEGRLSKLRERNKGLDDQRKTKEEKQAEAGVDVPLVPSRPQRYSSTSGMDHAPTVKRTWTVGDSVDDGETHRGGVKHKKVRGKPKGRQLGTGVNAIPVG